MSRAFAALALVALFTSGCVPVVTPIGDIEKAEPDKALVGTWTVTGRKGLTTVVSPDEFTIDAPVVKGNPKGLMRAAENDSDYMWFFTATLGGHTYATALLGSKDGDNAPSFAKEGAFAEWQKAERKKYFVFRYALDGDTLSINSGNMDAFAKLMSDAGVRDDGAKHVPFFLTEPKWAETHFAKGAADKVYDKTNVMTLKRKK